ncbi:hypothetical protein ANO11243_019990 [Dothideomycetidae sp. 11243]|nr:hypothetical protein ANO11243_019990 [fungal sp. No.11243]
MAFSFSAVCNLLQNIEDIFRHDPPLLPSDRNTRQARETDIWFKSHRRAIDGLDVSGAAALLSTLLPERRTDRVYGLQSTSLAKVLCRHLALSATQSKDVQAYRRPGCGDLADCIERALDKRGPPALPAVTLNEVDAALLDLASTCQFSSPKIKQRRAPGNPCNAIANIFRRLYPIEAKWLVRLILKDLSAIHLDEHLILRSIHFLLPDILHYQQDFDAALQTLKELFAKYPSSPDRQSAALLRKLVSGSHRPKIGIKVSRSTFCKARSIDHCLQITAKRHWMIERKYDGEFCEIHVDISKGDDWLKIFSKSGKDSTDDRRGLKNTLKKSLGIGTNVCRVREKCIILGEMVVYSEDERQVMPFHKIRKYVSRSGTYLGTTADSPRRASERLMIILFDLLLLDENNVMQKPLEERKAMLQSLCRTKPGKAIIAESKVLDFAISDSKRKLMSQLAASVAARHEGLILKPCGVPYLSTWTSGERDHSVMIKLKKDYINGLGDEADFAVIGASYNAQIAQAKGLKRNSFTHFHVACLLNPDIVDRCQARPRYKVVGTITCDGCIPPDVLVRVNTLAHLREEPYSTEHPPSVFDLQSGSPRMDVTFREPFVFEVLGSSYEKPSDCNYWMLRHPRVKKLHQDRTWRDCVSFADLQKLAQQALAAPPDSESQENLRWMERIEKSCRRKLARASLQTTPSSKATTSPVSVRRRSSDEISGDAAISPLSRVPQRAVLFPSPNHDSRSRDDFAGPEILTITDVKFGNSTKASNLKKWHVVTTPNDPSGKVEDPWRRVCALPGLTTPPPSSPHPMAGALIRQTTNKRTAPPLDKSQVKRICPADIPASNRYQHPLSDITNTSIQNLSSGSQTRSKLSPKEQAQARKVAEMPGRTQTEELQPASGRPVINMRPTPALRCEILSCRTQGRCNYCPLSNTVVYVAQNHCVVAEAASAHAIMHGAWTVRKLEHFAQSLPRPSPPQRTDTEVPDSQQSPSSPSHAAAQRPLRIFHIGRGMRWTAASLQEAVRQMIVSEGFDVRGSFVYADITAMLAYCCGVDEALDEDDIKSDLQRGFEERVLGTRRPVPDPRQVTVITDRRQNAA